MTAAGDRVQRFTVSDRLEHWVQMASFVVLGLTGLIQRYSEAWISERLLNALGGVETVRDIHRVSATLLMVAVVYHFGSVFYRAYVLRQPRAMLPGRADVTAIKGSFKYVFGMAAKAPPQGRFTWEEKVEYWSFVWGTVVMVITGYMLWNPIATTKFLPGQFVPSAKAIHGGEAVLAVLAIIIWHTYHVHIRHPNRAIFTGKLSREEMEEFHPLELAAIDGGGYSPPEGEDLRRRVQRFVGIYGVLAVVLLGAVYLFVNIEETAIDTITPPEQVHVFAPIETLAPGAATTTAPTSPTTTVGPDSPGVDASWDGEIAGLLDPACTACHGTNIQTAGLDLSSYSAALAGGESGAAVVAGDPVASVIIMIQEAGDHYQDLSSGDLAVLRGWIVAGAAEGGGGTVTPAPGGLDWESSIAAMFDPGCTGCHGANLQSGGLDLSSYETALSGVVPGDAAGSVLVQVQDAGRHPGQLSAEDLAKLKEWIDAGAAEVGGGTTGTTPPAAAAPSWDDAVAAVFDPGCTGCHGANLQSGGLDLSSYATAVAGGGTGAGVVPGDASGSVIVQVQGSGSHPGLLSAEDLALVKEWIDAGAAEAGGGGATPPVAAGTTWDGAIAGLFDPSCTTCHGANLQSGGLDLSSYSAAMAGGGRGAGLVPGDAAGSVIVQILDAGVHPAVLSAEDLTKLKEWIDAGATEG